MEKDNKIRQSALRFLSIEQSDLALPDPSGLSKDEVFYIARQLPDPIARSSFLYSVGFEPKNQSTWVRITSRNVTFDNPDGLPRGFFADPFNALRNEDKK